MDDPEAMRAQAAAMHEAGAAIIDIGGERIIVRGVGFTGGVVCVEARVYRDVEQVHLLGDG